MSANFKAVLINRSGDYKEIYYDTLANIPDKFTIKGEGSLFGFKFEDYNDITILGYKNGLEKHINKTDKNLTITDFTKFYDDIFGFEDLDDTLLEDELFEQDDDYEYDDFVVKDEDGEEYGDDDDLFI